MIRDDKGLVKTAKGKASGSALLTNQVVKLAFTCDKKTNGFKINQVMVE